MDSLFVTILCLLWALILVFVGTLLQMNMDVHVVEQTLFRSFFIWWKAFPVLPGGATLAVLLMTNLGVSFWKGRYWKKVPLTLIHVGFALLILGEGLRMMSAEESHMILVQNQPVDYSESPTDWEIAVLDPSSNDDAQATVVAIDGNDKVFSVPNTPLQVRVSTDSYELLGHGIWPLEEGVRQSGPYEVSVRRRRFHHPFTIELDKFTHETHPGTDLPKSFSSEVKVRNDKGEIDRSVIISMNNPLYFKGKTFYQSGYGDSDDVSVLHVVENRWKMLPYFSLGMIAAGLLFHFVALMRRKR